MALEGGEFEKVMFDWPEPRRAYSDDDFGKRAFTNIPREPTSCRRADRGRSSVLRRPPICLEND